MSDAPAPEAPEAEPPAPELVHGHPVSWSGDQQVVHPSLEGYVGLVKALIDDGFELIVDLCGVDYLTHGGRSTLPAGVTPERFEVVLNLLSMQPPRRVRVRLQVAEGAVVPSLFDVFPGAEGQEREIYDMYGIEFSGHPDLTRVLMPEDWIGYPLRKDYDVGRIPVQFTHDRTGRPPRPEGR